MRHLIWAALTAALTAACASSPPPRFYTLDTVPAGNAASAEGADAKVLSVWVAPVTLPEAVDRPQMVVRTGANRVAVLDQHRWAEPLKTAIARALAADLSAQLGNARVSADSQHAAAGAQVRVLVDVQRLDAVPGESVTLEALWSVRRTEQTESQRGRFLITEPVAGKDFEALAAAHARAIAALSRDIARGVEAR